MIFRCPGVEKLGRTSSMNIKYTQVTIFPTIVTLVFWSCILLGPVERKAFSLNGGISRKYRSSLDIHGTTKQQ